MEKDKYIFDLDGTLLTMDYRMEKMYFVSMFGPYASLLTDRIGELLDKYEHGFKKYDVNLLSKYLSINTGLDITPKIVEGWINIVAYGKDTMEDGVIEVLDELKSQDKKLLILSNWFSETQVPRLKNAGIYEYFDEIITGEECLKPHKEAYYRAIGDSDPSKCLLIGDNYDKDYCVPVTLGLDAVLYDKEDKYEHAKVKIKQLNEIIRK